MVLTPRRRLVQRRLVAVPIGVFVHLLLDGIWTDTQAFWWPFAGLAWSDAAAARAGAGRRSTSCWRRSALAALWWCWRRFRLDEPARRRAVPAHRPARPGRTLAVTRVIVVVRHGRTAANAGGLLLGRADPALDDEGRAAGRRRSAAACAGLDVARVVTSPLARCRATAAVVAASASGRRARSRSTTAWIELDYGELDGAPAGRRARPTTWAAWRADVDVGAAGRRVAGRRSARGCGPRAPTWSPRPPAATSWWSATCRRSRRPWRGRWASVTR